MAELQVLLLMYLFCGAKCFSDGKQSENCQNVVIPERELHELREITKHFAIFLNWNQETDKKILNSLQNLSKFLLKEEKAFSAFKIEQSLKKSFLETGDKLSQIEDKLKSSVEKVVEQNLNSNKELGTTLGRKTDQIDGKIDEMASVLEKTFNSSSELLHTFLRKMSVIEENRESSLQDLSISMKTLFSNNFDHLLNAISVQLSQIEYKTESLEQRLALLPLQIHNSTNEVLETSFNKVELDALIKDSFSHLENTIESMKQNVTFFLENITNSTNEEGGKCDKINDFILGHIDHKIELELLRMNESLTSLLEDHLNSMNNAQTFLRKYHSSGSLPSTPTAMNQTTTQAGVENVTGLEELQFYSQQYKALLASSLRDIDTLALSVNYTRVKQKEPTIRPIDCYEVLQTATICLKSGVFSIYPFGKSGKSKEAYCDMETDGGGWTVFLTRKSGNRPTNFNRTWKEYKEGFGNASGEYWLADFVALVITTGNEALHNILKHRPNSLGIEAETESSRLSGVYSEFALESEAEKYRIHAAKWKGDRIPFITIHDLEFSTKDEDNDKKWRANCASKCGGGWWHEECECLNPTGQFATHTTKDESYDYQYDPRYGSRQKVRNPATFATALKLGHEGTVTFVTDLQMKCRPNIILIGGN